MFICRTTVLVKISNATLSESQLFCVWHDIYGKYLQGAFGKNALIAFGLTTYTLLGLGVVCLTFTTYHALPHITICQISNGACVVFMYSPIVSIITLLPILAKFYSFLASFLSDRRTSVTSMGTLCAHMPGLQIRIIYFSFTFQRFSIFYQKRKSSPSHDIILIYMFRGLQRNLA